MPQTYDYNVSDTLNNKADPKALHAQIAALTVGSIGAPAVLDKALNGISIDGSGIHIEFAGALSDTGPLDAVVGSHDGVPLPTTVSPAFTDSGKQKVQIEPREGTPYQSFSINFCDPCSWWSGAKKVESSTMEEDTNDPSGKTFKFMDTDGTTHRKFIIDVRNGRMTQEHKIEPEYGVVVTVNSEVQTEQEFDYRADAASISVSGTGMNLGDYVLNPEEGTITFHDVPSEVPVATFWYAWECCWYITPSEGKSLTLLAVEIQFTSDVEPRSDVHFQPQIIAAYAAAGGKLDPSLLASNGGPIPDQSYIDDPSSVRKYKRLHDFMTESQRTYPSVDPMGGDGNRGVKKKMHTLRWPYDEEAARVINAAIGTRLKVLVDKNIPFLGEYASVSVYALSS